MKNSINKTDNVITNRAICNSKNYKFFEYSFNLIGNKGLSFHFNREIFSKSYVFHSAKIPYCIINHKQYSELFIFENKNLPAIKNALLEIFSESENEQDALRKITAYLIH